MDLQNWQKTATVTLTATDGEQEQVYRLTFATCSNYDIALYVRRRQELAAYLVEVFGTGWGGKEEAMALLSVMLHHLIVLAGLKVVEVQEGDTWTQTRLPDAWYDWRRFPQETPAGLLESLSEAVFLAGNDPKLFSMTPVDEDEKKDLRLTVQPSSK